MTFLNSRDETQTSFSTDRAVLKEKSGKHFGRKWSRLACILVRKVSQYFD
jgi:hypothetical protein